MRAWRTSTPGGPLVPHDAALREPGPHEIRVRVLACGVCRTDLHIIDGDLPARRAGVAPGHEIVGEVLALGAQAKRFSPGQRVGVPWLGGVCGECPYCAMGRENLCDRPLFTGYDRDGGFAQYACADEHFCFALPARYDDIHAAPLLCAGLIGWRAWRMAADLLCHNGRTDATQRSGTLLRLGLYGFGAASHILTQVAQAHSQQVFAFTRPGDQTAQAFARTLGAAWAGGSNDAAPELLDAAIIFAPVGTLVPTALAAVRKGGAVVCAGIHMSAIPSFDYALLWGERRLASVANLTRDDGAAFFKLLDKVQVQTHVQAFALHEANTALQALRAGLVNGAAVLVP